MSTMIPKQYAYDHKVMTIHSLRVNVKSLAMEAKIIRKETLRAGPAYRCSLHYHRTGRLREEARLAHLALAFVRGRPYKSVEYTASKPVDSKALANKLAKFIPSYVYNYKPENLLNEVKKWLD